MVNTNKVQTLEKVEMENKCNINTTSLTTTDEKEPQITATATSKDENALDVDDILQRIIGQYGFWQKVLVGIFCLLIIPGTYQTLIMTFIGNNPTWRCISVVSNKNSTKTNTGCMNVTSSTPGDVFDKSHAFYEKRCSMKRDSWEYTKDKSYSIVTEVKKKVSFPSTLLAPGLIGLSYLPGMSIDAAKLESFEKT